MDKSEEVRQRFVDQLSIDHRVALAAPGTAGKGPMRSSRLQLSTMPASAGLSREAGCSLCASLEASSPKCSTSTGTTTLPPRPFTSSQPRDDQDTPHTPHLQQHHLIVPCSSHQQRQPHFLRIIQLAASRAADLCDCAKWSRDSKRSPTATPATYYIQHNWRQLFLSLDHDYECYKLAP